MQSHFEHAFVSLSSPGLKHAKEEKEVVDEDEEQADRQAETLQNVVVAVPRFSRHGFGEKKRGRRKGRRRVIDFEVN